MLTKEKCIELSRHLKEMSKIFEEASKGLEDKKKRGRKPGPVTDDLRCKGEIANGGRCKNSSVKDGVCGKHAKSE